MVVDALKEADQVLRFSEDMDDPANFLRLDDTLLRQVSCRWRGRERQGEGERKTQALPSTARCVWRRCWAAD